MMVLYVPWRRLWRLFIWMMVSPLCPIFVAGCLFIVVECHAISRNKDGKVFLVVGQDSHIKIWAKAGIFRLESWKQAKKDTDFINNNKQLEGTPPNKGQSKMSNSTSHHGCAQRYYSCDVVFTFSLILFLSIIRSTELGSSLQTAVVNLPTQVEWATTQHLQWPLPRPQQQSQPVPLALQTGPPQLGGCPGSVRAQLGHWHAAGLQGAPWPALGLINYACAYSPKFSIQKSPPSLQMRYNEHSALDMLAHRNWLDLSKLCLNPIKQL